MGQLVEPEVFFIGYSTLDLEGMKAYLERTDNNKFLEEIEKAKSEGISDGEILTSFYAKLCYQSLTEGKNKNIEKVRGIRDNVIGTIKQAHGSVFEHAQLNFVVHNGSRVFEPEVLRHRVGTAFSIESGRYFRGDCFNLVFDPILEPVRTEVIDLHAQIESCYNEMVKKMGLDQMKNKDQKKKITSALRRIMPEGKAKELGISINLRQLRHMIQLRTNRQAEWEIRHIFSQVYQLVKKKHPLLFYGAKEKIVEGLLEVSGMKLQPYEKMLSDYTEDEIQEEVNRRFTAC